MLPHSSWSFKAALLPPAKRIERKDRPPSHNIWSGYSPGLYIHIKILRVVIAAVVTENNSANRIIFCVVYELGNSPEALEFELPLAHSANLHMSQAGNLIYSSLEVSLHWTQKALFFFLPFCQTLNGLLCVSFFPLTKSWLDSTKILHTFFLRVLYPFLGLTATRFGNCLPSVHQRAWVPKTGRDRLEFSCA